MQKPCRTPKHGRHARQTVNASALPRGTDTKPDTPVNLSDADLPGPVRRKHLIYKDKSAKNRRRPYRRPAAVNVWHGFCSLMPVRPKWRVIPYWIGTERQNGTGQRRRNPKRDEPF